jgi:hypothetical protein
VSLLHLLAAAPACSVNVRRLYVDPTALASHMPLNPAMCQGTFAEQWHDERPLVLGKGANTKGQNCSVLKAMAIGTMMHATYSHAKGSRTNMDTTILAPFIDTGCVIGVVAMDLHAHNHSMAGESHGRTCMLR